MSLEFFSHSEILAPFFFLIGMQLRNETTHIKEILLPSIAALGGMIFPALIFILINSEPDIRAGWPLVMPTDIALVMLVLLSLSSKVRVELKLFLLALAVADDLLSILVLAFKYSGELKASEVLASVGAVILGAIIGKIPKEKVFTQFVNLLVIPIYVLANIAPTLTSNIEFSSSLGNSIIFARYFGKIFGITLFAIIGAKLLKAPLKLSNSELIGGSALAGMGLAVSIMIANLSYTSEVLLNQAKAGLLLAAVISGIAGAIILLLFSPENTRRR
jgi:Na+:H+ antiporter, NhaA family